MPEYEILWIRLVFIIDESMAQYNKKKKIVVPSKPGIYHSISLFIDNASLQPYLLCFNWKLKQYLSNKNSIFIIS